MPFETDQRCPLCGGEVRYAHTTRGYDDPETGDREDPVVIYSCTKCGLFPEEELVPLAEVAPTGAVPPVPSVPLEVKDGDVIEYRRDGIGPDGLDTGVGTINEIAEDCVWLDGDGDPDHDIQVSRKDILRVIPWEEFLRSL